MTLTFVLVSFSYIFFRAESINHAFNFIKDMFFGLTTKSGYVQSINLIYWEVGIITPTLIALFIIIEWIGREDKFAIERTLSNKKPIYKHLFLLTISIFIFLFMNREGHSFIYFQF